MTSDFDLVTLAQLERGDVRLYRVRFTSGKGVKTYTYKSAIAFDVGDKAAYRLYGSVPPSNGGSFGSVVEILEEVKTIEPGIQYNWILGRVVDYTPLEDFQNADNAARNLLAMIRAKAEMRAFTEELAKHSLLPAALGAPKADDTLVEDDDDEAGE